MTITIHMIILENYTRKQFREWLYINHKTEKEVFIVVSLKKENVNNKSKSNNITYLDALYEALCFGWIDSTVRRYNSCEGLYLQRFSPRRKNSHWTELNKARVEMLMSRGLVEEPGLKEYKKAKPFIIDEKIINALKNSKEGYKNFLAMPQIYQRIRIDSIQNTKSNKELFLKRINKFIEECEGNIIYLNCEEKLKPLLPIEDI